MSFRRRAVLAFMETPNTRMTTFRRLTPRRQCSNRHPMSPEDLDHLGRVRWPSRGGIHDLAGFPKVGWTHDRRSDYRQLLRILRTKVVEAMDGAARDADGLAGPDLDGLAIDGPGHHTLDPVQRLLVSVVFVGWRGQLLPGRDRHFEDGDAAVGVVAGQEEANAERPDPNRLFRWI